MNDNTIYKYMCVHIFEVKILAKIGFTTPAGVNIDQNLVSFKSPKIKWSEELYKQIRAYS